MWKNKKLLTFLALNSMAGAVSMANNNELTGKYKNTYNKMTKNLNKSISNEKNYKLLEKVLNQRNKELKDLYLQSDYIVKPEYLEWQIFFSDFYNSKDRKGEKETDIIPIPSTAGKIDVSIRMPDFKINDPNINIKKVIAEKPEVNINKKNAAVPGVSYNENIVIPEFVIPVLPEVSAEVEAVYVRTGSISGYGDTRDVTYYDADSGTFSNYNIESGTFNYNAAISTTGAVSRTFDYNNAAGTIDPTALVNTSLNQPAVIPDSASGTTPGYIVVQSTSAPNIRIGEDVTINFVSSSMRPASWMHNKVMVQSVFSPNRSALNADTEYAYGGIKEYPDADANIPFSILRNSGTINMSGNYALAGVLSAYGSQSTSRNDYLLVNDGTIIGDYSGSNDHNHVGLAFDTFSGNASTKGERLILGNDGKMEFRAPASTAFHMGGVNLNKYQTVYNRGLVDMYGSDSIGIKMANSSLNGYTPSINLINTKILMETPINMHGDKSIGAYITLHMMKAEDSIFKINIGTEGNSYGGNIDGNNPDYVENSVGMYLRAENTNSYANLILKDYDIRLGNKARESVLFFNEGTNSYNRVSGTYNYKGESTLDNSMVQSINVDAGEDNMVIYNSGSIINSEYSSVPIINIKPDIKIGTESKPVDGTIAIYNTGGIAHLTGDIETYGESSHAVYNDSVSKVVGTVTNTKGSTFDNIIGGNAKALSIITHGDNSAVFYNKESVINLQEGGTFKALGENGVVLYNKSGNINITGDAVLEAGNKGTLIMNDSGTINFGGNMTYNVKNNSVFAYAVGTPGIKIDFSNGGNSYNQTLNLEGGSIGFVYDGGSADTQQNSLYNYLRDNFSGLNNLTVNVSDDSRLFLLNNYGTLKLSDLEQMDTGESLFRSVNGNGGNSLLNKGTLVLDTAGVINLDDPDNVYANTDKAATGITVNAGVTVAGTQDGQLALGGKDIYRGTPGGNTYVVMNNHGTIDLSGNNSLGIYTNNGLINNYSEVNITGGNSAGLYGENGSVVTNSGNINISDNSVGIYALSYQKPATPDTDFGDGTVNVTNSGVITAGVSEKAAGIYASNNKTGALRSSGFLNLSTGTVDMELSKESTGVYADNVTVSGGGTLNVGESGTGLYAKNSDLNISDMTINMKKDNSVGMYLDSGSTLNASGTNTVNITGKNNTVFYVETDGTFEQNFMVNGDENADYTLMYIKNNTAAYNGEALMSGNSTVFYGENSSIVLGESALLRADGGNTAGIYADGLYSGTADYEAINNGKIQFGDNSAGLYGVNGARLLNTGTVTVGNKSLGLSSEDSSHLRNEGTVKTENDSVGISAENTELVENTGNVSAAGENITGLYSKTTGTSVINNEGTIDLSGKNTTGVYLENGGQQVFNNKGIIKTGSSDNTDMSNTAVYNDGHVVNNSGEIISTGSTAGIYNNNGLVNHSAGSIISDANGLGIYSAGGKLELTGGIISTAGIGIYAENNTEIINTGTATKVSDNGKGYILKSGSYMTNHGNAEIGTGSVYVYGDNAGEIINNASSISMTGSNSVGFYLTNSGNVTNKADITGLSTGNVGIYSDKGSITNSGNIVLGDSMIIDPDDSSKNNYSVGIYAKGAEVGNTGNIKTGTRGTGIYTENNKLTNSGIISSDGEYAVGLWGKTATVENNGEIIMNGNYSQGIVGTSQSILVNNGIITMNGDNSTGISGSDGTKIQNYGTINLNGNNSTGILLSNGALLLNKGTINLGSGINNIDVGTGDSPTPPSIVNAGVIKVDGKFVLNGVDLTIQVDPDSIRKPEIDEITMNQYMAEDLRAKFLISNAVHFKADSFDFSKPAKIDPSFTQGTNSLAYKFENVFMAKDIESAESIEVDSHSVSFRAIPVMNENENVDVWMEKTPYQYFTDGTHYDELGKMLDENYVLDDVLGGQTGKALELYDKLDLITDSKALGKAMEDLSGEMYANTTRRMEDISDIFADSLEVLQNSDNNTKENVKINIIAGKGKTTENRNGILPYDYNSVGVMALREVERTYRHTFGYSLGYLRTDFQFEDTNNEDEANTIQLGIHSKYKADGWGFKTDLLGRVGFNSTDREIEWNKGDISKMSGDYNTYGAALINEVSKDLEIGKNSKIVPYAGLKLEYGYHTDIKENGAAEELSVDNNYYYSIKPNAGVELETAKYFGNSESWKVKMNVGVGYEYELGETNKTEKASLENISDKKFDLGKSVEDKGKFITNGGIGVEYQDRYGIFVTGKYKTAGNDEEDYQIGVNFKAAF